MRALGSQCEPKRVARVVPPLYQHAKVRWRERRHFEVVACVERGRDDGRLRAGGDDRCVVCEARQRQV